MLAVGSGGGGGGGGDRVGVGGGGREASQPRRLFSTVDKGSFLTIT